jgi:hypothetical protein
VVLIAITGLLAASAALTRSATIAFLNVYIPVLLLLPDYYRWILPALPDPTFGEAALLPIAAVYIVKDFRGWHYSFTDLLIVALALSMAYSEYRNAGYSDAQNLMFDMLGTIVLPYMLAKGIIEPQGLGPAFARRIVFLLAAVAVIGLYEFRLGMTPWQRLLHGFFPGQGQGWVTTFRYGFARVAGPYGHAILAGTIMVAGYRLARWLEWSGAWEPHFKAFRRLPVSKARMLSLILLAGVFMSMARGPWIAAICGAVFTTIGRAKNPKRAMGFALGAVLLVGVPAAAYLYSYASVGRAAARSQSQETAAYRKELIDKYVAIAAKHSVWGYGRNGWPRVDGMPSIDNYYLLLALMHGVIALALLIAILLWMPARLMMHAIASPSQAARGASLEFTLAGIFAVVAISIGTVFMGTQVVPLFAILTGWAEGLLLQGNRGARNAQDAGHDVEAEVPLFKFQRVVA